MSGSAVMMLLLSLQAPVAASTGGQAAVRDDPMASETMRSDARLADVCFVDTQHGWAVGDRGTIWHTDDAGRNWRLQRSTVAWESGVLIL